MRRSTTILVTGAVTALLTTAALLWYVRERSVAYFTDADTIRRPVAGTDPRDVLWRPPEELPVAVNTGAEEYEPRISADGTTLFFVRGKAGANADLFVAARTPDGWGTPEPAAGVNSDADELGPEPTHDGRRLYFYSNRAGGAGGYDLWYADRGEDGWRDPVNLGPTVNTGFNEYGPALTPGDDALYFASNRPRSDDPDVPDADAWPATVREDLYRSDYDLYLAPVTDRGFGVPQPVTTLNTPHNDGALAVSPVGDFLYFASDRPGGVGGFDLYRSRRLRGEHRPPSNLGPAVNTGANELDPGVGLGGFGLHFSSDRVVDAGPAGLRNYDLFRTTSREVFTESESVRASIDWAQLLPLLWWLLLALLTLLLVWLLSRVMRSERFGRLGLLARCLLASMLVHLLLMVLLAFWGVGSSLSNWMQRSGGTRVALLTRAADGDIAAQLRGTLTEVAVEVPVTRVPPAETAVPVDRDRATEVTVPLAPTDPGTTTPLRVEPTRDAPTPDAATPRLPRPPRTVTAVAPAPVVPVTLPPTATPAQTDERRADAVSRLAPSATPRESMPVPTPANELAEAIEVSIARAVALPSPIALAAETTPREVLPPTPPTPEPGLRQRPAAAPPPDASSAPAFRTAPPRARPLPRPESALALPSMPAATVVTRDEARPTLAMPEPTDEPARSAPSAAVTTLASRALVGVVTLDQPALRPVETDVRRLAPASGVPRSLVEPRLQRPDAPLPTRDVHPPPLADVVPATTLALDLPAPPVTPPVVAEARNPQRQRDADRRRDLVEQMGGSEETEEAVAAALAWLARHQSPDGRWDGAQFDDGCGQCDGPTRIEVDIALTGLALLSFLAADHTHLRDGPYREVVTQGLTWLRAQQDEDGSLLRRESMYSHGIASIALAEVYGMTADPGLREPVRRAVDFIVDARDRRGGGWRYAPRQAGDTSVTGWQVMALVSARKAGVEPAAAGFEAARRWLDRVSAPGSPGLYAYRPRQDATPAMTAEGMFIQQLLGHARDEAVMRSSAEYLMANPPRWREGANTYYWYYATLALFQHQGLPWSRWNDVVRDALVAHQVQTGPAAGSWEPVDQWARTGGRVYQTAICALTLEVYYRYLPTYLTAEGTEGSRD